jgi:hypothetical protein
MARGRARWSNEEEQVLIDQVRQNPGNLSRAFRATSNELGKSYYAVKQQWYNRTRHSETVFMTVGSNTMSVNSKNSESTQPVQLPIWRRILKLLGL